ncbi:MULTISPECIES: hypothetical protein [Niastella]|uniref:Uncharacterized protein n=1 Tax=Niastella soli TaxID=2821487 RepID=A0ABS3Z658_9BACT|nr:hypothetical protein [Niastella soli]MBO9204941.1 hypothetical protein [Niastella soli]
MDSQYERLTATELRAIVIQEMRKFTWALELGSTVSDLEEIRNHIRSLVDMLSVKENRETGIVEKIPQINQSSHN